MSDLKSSNTELIAGNAAISAMKRKVENDVQIAKVRAESERFQEPHFWHMTRNVPICERNGYMLKGICVGSLRPSGFKV